MRQTLLVTVLCTALVGSLASPSEAQYTAFVMDPLSGADLFLIDTETGWILESYPITGAEFLSGGLAHDGSHLWTIDGFNDGLSDRTFRIDPATGEGMVIGETGENWNSRNVEVHPLTGVLYACRDNELYTIDKETGIATSVAPITGATLDQAAAMAIDSNGNAYLTDLWGPGLFELDLVTGAATHLGNLAPGGDFFTDLAFDPNDQLWGVLLSGATNGSRVFTIDIADASIEFRFGAGTARGIAFAPASGTVGGSITGVTPRDVVCRNLTTGQSVSASTTERTWDCEALGLIVDPGDKVFTGARGEVN